MTRPALAPHPADPVPLSLPGGVVLACVPALIVLAVLQRPIWDVDIFWQLKLGELILARGGPVAREPFAATHLGESLPALAWLGQAVMAQLRLWSGWSGLALGNALGWAGALALAGRSAAVRGVSRESATIAMAAGLLVAMPWASVRPQTFGMLAFATLLWLVERPGSARRRLLAGALLLVAWQNLHPSVAVAVAWLGSRALWCGWCRWCRGVADPAGARWAELAGLTGVAALALVATPDGLGFLHIAAGNAATSQTLRVSEWLPLWAPENHAFAVVALVLALGVLGLAWRRIRAGQTIDGGQVLPWLVLLGLGALSARILVFWGVALVPVLAEQLPRFRAPGRLAGAGLRGIDLALALVAGLAMSLAGPVRFAGSIPVAQIAALQAAGVRGTVFAHVPWGGAVIDRGYPAWRVAYDGRYYRYNAAEWRRYAALAEGRVGLAEIERRYRPAAYVLDAGWTPRLVAELRARPDLWRELPGAGPATVFVPRRPR